MNIRQASREDIPEVIRLWECCAAESDALAEKNSTDIASQIRRIEESSKNVRHFYEQKLLEGSARMHIAEEGREIVAFSFIYIKDNVPIYKIGKTGYLSDLFVKKEFRQQGIASAFRDLAFEWFREQGVSAASIMVFPHNRLAREIYRKWGFFDYHIELRKEI